MRCLFVGSWFKKGRRRGGGGWNRVDDGVSKEGEKGIVKQLCDGDGEGGVI